MNINKLPRNKWGDIEIIYPKRTAAQQRDKLRSIIGPPVPHKEWIKWIKNASDEEISGTYNWLCAVGRIND